MSKPKKANALDIHFHQFSEMAAKPIICRLHFLSRRKPAQTGKTEPENTKVKRFAFDPRKKKNKKFNQKDGDIRRREQMMEEPFKMNAP
jgi:hypothetical protein